MKDREGQAASVVARVLPEIGLAGPVWVAGDPTGEVEAAVLGGGASVLAWRRSGPAGTAWPGGQRGTAAVLRLPKGREAFRMALHALAARTEPGGALLVYGANDEGIRSADKVLGEVAENPRTLDTRRHCRVWLGELNRGVDLRGELDDWAEPVHARFPTGEASWVSFPGLFAHPQLDPATALLLESLTKIAKGARVLDFGCGAGAIAVFLVELEAGLEIHALDVDPLALEAAGRNVPEATLHQGDGLAALTADLRFDRIFANPPIHSRRDLQHDVVRALCRGARNRLRPGGELWIVAQRTVPVGKMLAGFRRVESVRETRSFRVWRATSA